MILFVYGSLRKEQYNAYLLKDVKFVGVATTAPKFKLMDLGGYPGMHADGNTSVVGELYEIDPKSEQAKRIEGMEVRYGYELTKIKLVGGRAVNAYVSKRKVEPYYKEIPGGDWVAHRKEAGH